MLLPNTCHVQPRKDQKCAGSCIGLLLFGTVWDCGVPYVIVLCDGGRWKASDQGIILAGDLS